jgi:LAGLIDADG endonuclease
MGSHNPTGADNQQERPVAEQWVVGFVDGEGCFSISVVRNATCRLGWQVQHEFAVTQAHHRDPLSSSSSRCSGAAR